MDTFAVNLNYAAKRGGKYLRFLVVSSLVLIVLFVLTSIFFLKYGQFNKWLFILYGVYIVSYFYALLASYNARIYIKANKYALSYHFLYYRKAPFVIVWKTVKTVKIGPTYLEFFKLTGKSKRINIGWISYKELMIVKKRVESLARNLGIEVNRVEIQNQ